MRTQHIHPRFKRERRTVAAMLQIYCSDQHASTDGLCSECAEMLAYAEQRLANCPYQEQKPTCANCPIHCYRKEMREQMRVVMRYAGPRMLLRHPFLAIAHLVDGVRKAPNLQR